MMLTESQGQELLRMARSELNAYFGASSAAADEPGPTPSRPIGGLFVTLERDEELRGCIGFLRGDDSPAALTRRAVVSAAFEDPRFDRVTEDELDELRITVTVLAPAEPIRGPDEVEVGRHGLVVESGGHRGLLLPSVAVERGWDSARFLAETCRKAGLPADSWKLPETALERFEAESFEEKRLTT